MVVSRLYVTIDIKYPYLVSKRFKPTYHLAPNHVAWYLFVTPGPICVRETIK